MGEPVLHMLIQVGRDQIRGAVVMDCYIMISNRVVSGIQQLYKVGDSSRYVRGTRHRIITVRCVDMCCVNTEPDLLHDQLLT
jgi:hypothetical protein